MEENMKEFVAYLRKLKRNIEDIEELMDAGNTEQARAKLAELKEDTQKDIES